MQSRNVLAIRIAGTIAMQFITVAQFLLFKSVPALVLLSILVTVLGVIFTLKCRISRDNIPDSISLRSAREVLEYAYEYAKPALIFNMTVSMLVLSIGILIALFTSSVVFFVALSVFAWLFIPSFDRLSCYKQMLSNHVSVSESLDKKLLVLFCALMPLTSCIYLIWKYTFSYKPEIAWIVFCLALVIYGAVWVLFANEN